MEIAPIWRGRPEQFVSSFVLMFTFEPAARPGTQKDEYDSRRQPAQGALVRPNGAQVLRERLWDGQTNGVDREGHGGTLAAEIRFRAKQNLQRRVNSSCPMKCLWR